MKPSKSERKFSEYEGPVSTVRKTYVMERHNLTPNL